MKNKSGPMCAYRVASITRSLRYVREGIIGEADDEEKRVSTYRASRNEWTEKVAVTKWSATTMKEWRVGNVNEGRNESVH